jgi:hypothetical protein
MVAACLDQRPPDNLRPIGVPIDDKHTQSQRHLSGKRLPGLKQSMCQRLAKAGFGSEGTHGASYAREFCSSKSIVFSVTYGF